jgi:hypothetical protein
MPAVPGTPGQVSCAAAEIPAVVVVASLAVLPPCPLCRHVGKGAAPRELDSVAQMIDFVARTPGGVGYIDAAALKPGINVIARLP